MASSVTYAALKNILSPRESPISVSVINIPREDFHLRTEAAWLFAEAGVDVGNLVFLDEIDPAGVLARAGSSLVLVDHNKLSDGQSRFETKVEEILDHHTDEGKCPGAQRLIAPVGSSATLVEERFLESAPDSPDKASGILLLGTILLDTVNLDPEAKRVTPRDEDAAARLIALTGVDGKALFDKLQFEKFNVASLSSRDILRKDYKGYKMGRVSCGVSSALLPLKDWTKKDPALEESFEKYRAELGLDVLLAMCAYTAPEFRRELAVYAKEPSLREKLTAFLNTSGLGLSPLGLGPAAGFKNLDLFSQADMGGSRKKVQPLLAGFFETL
jgi:exopolyphosphatase